MDMDSDSEGPPAPAASQEGAWTVAQLIPSALGVLLLQLVSSSNKKLLAPLWNILFETFSTCLHKL